MSEGELILYTTEDGTAEIQLRAVDGTAWLSLNQIADLFDRDKSVISRHIKAILEDGELRPDSVVARYATTAADGKTYQVDHYRLEMIFAVGYRVRSTRGVQFRRWATTVLHDYLVKGFAMNDERLKDPGFDYFDELLERIRDIRASEARFYQKVRDILALSIDYDPKANTVQTFYATIQNKMLHAVAHYTAAELIKARSDADAPNMGLTSWKGGRVRKADVTTAKNYLGDAEIKELNLIVGMFLDAAELRATRRQEIHLAEWEAILDTLSFDQRASPAAQRRQRVGQGGREDCPRPLRPVRREAQRGRTPCVRGGGRSRGTEAHRGDSERCQPETSVAENKRRQAMNRYVNPISEDR